MARPGASAAGTGVQRPGATRDGRVAGGSERTLVHQTDRLSVALCAARFVAALHGPLHFAQWTADGTLEALMHRLREQSRGRAGRSAQPTAGVIDRQTVKSVEATQAVGWDGGK